MFETRSSCKQTILHFEHDEVLRLRLSDPDKSLKEGHCTEIMRVITAGQTHTHMDTAFYSEGCFQRTDAR